MLRQRLFSGKAFSFRDKGIIPSKEAFLLFFGAVFVWFFGSVWFAPIRVAAATNASLNPAREESNVLASVSVSNSIMAMRGEFSGIAEVADDAGGRCVR